MQTTEKSSLFCTVSTKIGHIFIDCYQVIGYPERWGKLTDAGDGHGRVGDRTGRGRRARGFGTGTTAMAYGTTSLPAPLGQYSSSPLHFYHPPYLATGWTSSP